jgi:hypothetical protein
MEKEYEIEDDLPLMESINHFAQISGNRGQSENPVAKAEIGSLRLSLPDETMASLKNCISRCNH